MLISGCSADDTVMLSNVAPSCPYFRGVGGKEITKVPPGFTVAGSTTADTNAGDLVTVGVTVSSELLTPRTDAGTVRSSRVLPNATLLSERR